MRVSDAAAIAHSLALTDNIDRQATEQLISCPQHNGDLILP
jgi:hypothetical protein